MNLQLSYYEFFDKRSAATTRERERYCQAVLSPGRHGSSSEHECAGTEIRLRHQTCSVGDALFISPLLTTPWQHNVYTEETGSLCKCVRGKGRLLSVTPLMQTHANIPHIWSEVHRQETQDIKISCRAQRKTLNDAFYAKSRRAFETLPIKGEYSIGHHTIDYLHLCLCVKTVTIHYKWIQFKFKIKIFVVSI